MNKVTKFKINNNNNKININKNILILSRFY